MIKEWLLPVGSSMAGMRAIEEHCKLKPAVYVITVFDAQPHPDCNRIIW